MHKQIRLFTARRTSGRLMLGRGRLGVLGPLLLAPVLALALAGTALATPIQPPASVAVNPGQGASGASVTLTGNGLAPNDPVQVGYATANCNGTITTISGATGTTDSSGNVTITFPWPSTVAGNYVVCVTDTKTHNKYQAGTPFTALPAPSISISSPVYSGKPITVTGSKFLPSGAPGGGTVDVVYGIGSGDPCANLAGTVSVGADGSFSVTFNAPHADTPTQITITAVEPSGTCGKTSPGPTLQAQQTVTVSPAPTIQVTNPMTSGDPATVTGHNFLPVGSMVEIHYGEGQSSDPCANTATTATVGSDGSFSASFKAPSVSNDTPINVVAVEGNCSQPTLRAAATTTDKAKSVPLPILEYCLIGLLLLLLLLLLLFLVFRARRRDQPVTIEERDRVVVTPNATGGSGGRGGPAGTALIDRQIVARDARGREVVIAEEVTTVEEEEEELP
jgi:hypothetical protein